MKWNMRLALFALLATAVVVQATVPDSPVPAVVDSHNIESVFAAVDAAQAQPAQPNLPPASPAPKDSAPTPQPDPAFIDAEVAAPAEGEEEAELPGTREGEPEVLEGSIMPPEDAEGEAETIPAETNMDAPQPLEASIGEVTEFAPDVVPSQDDEVRVIDFSGEQPAMEGVPMPSPEEMAEVRSRISSALSGFLSSFFGGDAPSIELNASPLEQSAQSELSAGQQAGGEVQTETREIPGGFVIVRSFRTPEGGEVTEQEAHQSFGSWEESPVIDPMPAEPPSDMSFFDLPPPPPMPIASLFERFFGPPRGEVERSLFGREEDAPLLAPQRPGCRKHRGLLGRLHALLAEDFAPLRRVPAFVGHHDEPEGWDRLMAGPFVRVEFAGGANEDQPTLVEAEAQQEQQPEEAQAEGFTAPTPEEQAQAFEGGYVAPHTYEVDYRMAEAPEQQAMNREPAPMEEPKFMADPPMDAMIEEEPQEEPHHYHHRGWFRRHRALVLALAGVLVLGLVGFTVFMCRQRKRLLAAAQVKQTTFAVPQASVEVVAAQPVQAFAIQSAPVHSNGYRLLQA